MNNNITVTSNSVPKKPRLIKPIIYRTSIATPPKYPKIVFLKSSSKHIIGIGFVWRKQSCIAWREYR